MLIGAEAILAALKSGLGIDRIYIDSKERNPAANSIKKLAGENGVPINYVPAAKLDSFNVSEHEGLIAITSKVQYFELQDILDLVIGRGEVPLLLILDGITDIRNIGAIARTAYCTGVHAIIIPAKGVGALNEDAILTSAGALEKIAICRVNSLMKAIDDLHLNGIHVYASEMNAVKKVYDCNFQIPACIVMGSEDKGINAALAKITDTAFNIPMSGNFESLNVSVATGMILYEAMKQRMTE